MSGCRVFVGHLSSRARERDVEKFFKGYGRIREIHLKNGFGFVEFEDHRDADDAIYELNGKELCDESRYGPPVRTEHRIIVENLSSRISWQLDPHEEAVWFAWSSTDVFHKSLGTFHADEQLN